MRGVELILARLQAAYRSDKPLARPAEWASRNRGPVLRRGLEALGIHAVVDLRNRLRGNPDLTLEVVFEMKRQRHIAGYESTVKPAHIAVAPPASRGIVDVPAVLAMDAHRHARRPGRHAGFQRRQISGVHDGRAKLLEQAIQPRVFAHQVARGLVELDVAHIRSLDPPGEFRRDLGQRDDRMPPTIRRHAVDQVDDSVLEPANAKTINDVDDEWRHGAERQGGNALHAPLPARRLRRAPAAGWSTGNYRGPTPPRVPSQVPAGVR